MYERKLTSKALSLLDESDQSRIDYIMRPKWVSYPLADELFRRIDGVSKQNRLEGSRIRNLIIHGDPGNGKSFLVQTYRKVAIQRSLEEEKDLPIEDRTVPVVVADFPVVPDERRMYSQILKAANIPHSTKAPAQHLANQIVSIFREIRVQLLILDEFHNSLMGPTKQQRRALVSLKNLSNELRLPIVLLGTTEARTALFVDAQFRTRFTEFGLPLWDKGAEIHRFLRNYERTLPLRGAASLTTVPVKSSVIARSKSLIGMMTLVVQLAAVEAIRSGSETITPYIVDSIKEGDLFVG